MKRFSFVILLLATYASHLCLGQSPVSAPEVAVEYLRDVKPLLQRRCYACHGALQQKAGLRLDTVPLMRQGGDSGSALAADTESTSLLWQRISATSAQERMPPEHEGEAFSAEQLDLLKRWLAAGAPAPVDEQPETDPRQHWAFQPCVPPPLPSVNNNSWVRNPIDLFIADQHARHELQPQNAAPREVLIRRLYLDLIGVPPTPVELARWQNAQSHDWYEMLVNSLLDDPRYGQRWARHWMDVWRYSDWWGLGDQLRNSQKHIWHWRDWIVESLNQDLPYDEMVRLMLAADELAPNDLDQLRASGFMARNYFLFNRHQWMDETIEHVGKAFLGLTFNCAKCHDHKYDPISQTDYYRLRAIFEPYHVRVDMVPEQSNLDIDGIPRPFDGRLDDPTWLLIRGQENSPDKSQVLAPGVPRFLLPEHFAVTTVQLPIEAAQPERRPWVGQALLADSQRRRQAAQESLAKLQRKLVDLKTAESASTAASDASVPSDTKRRAPVVSATPSQSLHELFSSLDTERWKTFGGEWSHEPGHLRQKRDGAVRSAVRLQQSVPRDFDATVRFTITGGSKWRSVCLAFDTTSTNPAEDPDREDSEIVVYGSAFEGGSKVQASYVKEGKWHYPEDGTVPMRVEIDKPYTLRVQARDRLLNVWLDGKRILAWVSPIERQVGSMQLTTFDALVDFHEFQLQPLAPDIPLLDPRSAAEDQKLAAIEKELHVAELACVVADKQISSVQASLLAMQATWKLQDMQRLPEPNAAALAAEQAKQNELAQAAATAERDKDVATAQHAVSEIEYRQQFGTAKQKAAAADELKKAEQKLKQALKRQEKETAEYTPIVGAAWTPTRFFDSTKDDPAISFPLTSSGRRTALARWITHPQHPLTARVAANQIWLRHFGKPLVSTVFDFGRKGTPATHPELLDWLASELVRHGWSMKHLHRLITTSATYRLSSSMADAAANMAKDPDNHYWWRREPQRLEGEVVRDSILALAGTLDFTAGGPSIPAAQQAKSLRRSLYFFHSNNDRNLFLTTFDGAMVKDCYRREQSIVPQQALALTNSQLVLTSAEAIAKKISDSTPFATGSEDSTTRDSAFVRWAFLNLLAIDPSLAETKASLSALQQWRQSASNPPTGQAITSEASDSQVMRSAEAQLVWVLLNHNDFVTLR